ncbi:MAG: uroporphyrinogen decarboxylase family protein [Chitinivibrionales bacterium]|nr:uroporphyrinogen decarboxylase family protein [Chitinivibrionales bacterium]
MISDRENYQRAIEFKSPQYLPCDLGLDLNWLYEKDPVKAAYIRQLQARFPRDMLSIGADRPSEITKNNGASRWLDEWGTGWVEDGHGAKTESYPLIEGYPVQGSFMPPDPGTGAWYIPADKQLMDRNGHYVRGSVWFTLFERLWMLRGFENMLMDPYVYEHEFCCLRDSIVEYNLAMIDQWVKRKVHAVFFSDDWGSQRGLLMNPDDWRRFYKPSYKRMFERVHAGGAHVWMHLCGNITAILPDLIEVGLNVLNPVQPQAMDVRRLSREFGGKVCFNGGVDVQGTMINGKPDDVKREVHQLINLFGRYSGGYIGGTSHNIMPETPLNNVIALYEAFLEYRKV